LHVELDAIADAIDATNVSAIESNFDADSVNLIQKVRTAAGWFPVDDAICVQATTFAELGHSFFQCIVPLSNRCDFVIGTALSREKGTFDSRLTRFESSVRPTNYFS
jgi:hypothetical protein